MRFLFILIRVLVVAVLVAAAAVVDGSEVVRFRVEDTIQPASQSYIERSLDEARERGAALVVMELDTPGGLLDTTREISTAITGSSVPVCVYVVPAGARAASAGFFILLSADIAAMAPGTNTGAAHPVSGQGQDMGEHLEAKATNDASAMIRSLAETRDRDPEKAVEAVVESASFTASEALEHRSGAAKQRDPGSDASVHQVVTLDEPALGTEIRVDPSK